MAQVMKNKNLSYILKYIAADDLTALGARSSTSSTGISTSSPEIFRLNTKYWIYVLLKYDIFHVL